MQLKTITILLAVGITLSIGVPALATISSIRLDNSTDFRNLIIGGTENDGNNNLYLCSGIFDGELTPGKYYIPTDTCYVPWGGKEQIITDKSQYNLWKDSSHSWTWGNFPGYTVGNNPIGGTENDGQNYLYFCRAVVDNELTPGKYYPPNNTCYVPWGGKEYQFQYPKDTFQILYGVPN